jgi:hypothetical protein
MNDRKIVWLRILSIAAASVVLIFLADRLNTGRRQLAVLETKVAALEARLDAEAAAKQQTIKEAGPLDIADPKSPLLFLINQ